LSTGGLGAGSFDLPVIAPYDWTVQSDGAAVLPKRGSARSCGQGAGGRPGV